MTTIQLTCVSSSGRSSPRLSEAYTRERHGYASPLSRLRASLFVSLSQVVEKRPKGSFFDDC